MLKHGRTSKQLHPPLAIHEPTCLADTSYRWQKHRPRFASPSPCPHTSIIADVRERAVTLDQEKLAGNGHRTGTLRGAFRPKQQRMRQLVDRDHRLHVLRHDSREKPHVHHTTSHPQIAHPLSAGAMHTENKRENKTHNKDTPRDHQTTHSGPPLVLAPLPRCFVGVYAAPLHRVPRDRPVGAWRARPAAARSSRAQSG